MLRCQDLGIEQNSSIGGGGISMVNQMFGQQYYKNTATHTVIKVYHNTRCLAKIVHEMTKSCSI